MMFDIISSLCAGLLVFCIANLYFSYDIMFNHRYEEEDPLKREKKRFAIGVNLVSTYMLIGCITWLLWDADLISKISQYKIGLAGRFFAISGSFIFFLTLSLGLPHKGKLIIVMSAIIASFIMYLFKVLT